LAREPWLPVPFHVPGQLSHVLGKVVQFVNAIYFIRTLPYFLQQMSG
jgi:hypothetical protein